MRPIHRRKLKELYEGNYPNSFKQCVMELSQIYPKETLVNYIKFIKEKVEKDRLRMKLTERNALKVMVWAVFYIHRSKTVHPRFVYEVIRLALGRKIPSYDLRRMVKSFGVVPAGNYGLTILDATHKEMIRLFEG